jgi:archaellum component FlaF (FlaF/FlaG flagellin family)
VDGVNLSNERVTATIRNYGTTPITSVQMQLIVDGNIVATETRSGTIAANATATYTFTATANLSSNGNHTITESHVTQ